MLFFICHSAPALSVAIWVCSLIKVAAIPASSALFMFSLMLVPPGSTVMILLNRGWYTPAPIDRDPFSLSVIQFLTVKAHFLQSGALSFSKRFSCIGWEGTWLCNVSLMSPIFALATLFLESLESLHIFAILGMILLVGGSMKGSACVFKIPDCRW